MHSQRVDKQGRVHLHPSLAIVGNRVRVLIPGCGRKAPLPNADSGASRVALPIPGSFAGGWQDVGLGSSR